jgi:hypothetical protein
MAVNFAILMSALKGSSEETKKKTSALQDEKRAQIQAQEAVIQSQRAFIDTAKSAGIMSSEVINAHRKIGMANQEIQKLNQLSLGGKISSITSSITSSAAYQKVGGIASGRLGSALTFAPLITEQVSNFIPKNSTGGRGASQAVSSLGTIASYAGAGAMIGGPLAPFTAAAGAAVGAMLEIPKVVNAFTDKIPDLTSAVASATDAFNKTDANVKSFLQASSNLSEAREKGGQSPEQMAKLRKARDEALSGFTTEQQLRITQARDAGGGVFLIKTLSAMTHG